MGGMIKPMCDRIMQVLIVIMQSSNKSSTVMEDACLTVGAVCSATEQEFLRYVDAVMPLLYAALSNHQEHSVFSF